MKNSKFDRKRVVMSASMTTFESDPGENSDEHSSGQRKQIPFSENINYQNNVRDEVYIINEAPLSIQKDFLNEIFQLDNQSKTHKNELLIQYGWEQDGPEGHGYYLHPMMLTKSEFEMIATQTKQHDPELWHHLQNLWFGNNVDKSQNRTFTRPDGSTFDLTTMALFKTIKGRIYLVNTIEAAIYGSGRKACPQTPQSIL